MKIAKNVKEILNIIYLLLFLLILLIPLFFTNNEKGVVSKIDNRKLAEFPEIGKVGFTSGLEKYLGDRIGYRNQMINAYQVLNDKAAGELIHPTYTYGQDGYIFFNMHENIEYGDFHKTFAEMVLKLQDYCEERGAKFYFLFDPEKIAVYERYLPEGVNYDNSWVDAMMSYMDELGINYVDNSAMLKERSMNEAVFNRQYDAGHWNDLGCFYATNALLERIHQDIQAVSVLKKDMFDITVTTAAELPVSEFKINEDVPKFTLRTEYEDVSSEYVNDVERDPSYQYFHYYINKAPDADTLPKTLIFQGSYYNRGPQFFVRAASEYIAVHNYQNVLNIDYYFNIFQPDVVIFDVAEYTFSNVYFNLANMKELDFNPVIITAGKSAGLELGQLMDDAELFTVDSYIDLFPGKKIDKVVVNRKFSDAEYVYLIANDMVFDLRKNDSGLYYASIPHGIIDDADNAFLYIEEYDGKKLYTPMTVQSVSMLISYISGSDGVTFKEGDTYEFVTGVEENRISAVVLSLYDEQTGEHVAALDSTTSVGAVEGQYKHEGEDGWYRFHLRANTSIEDEYIESIVYLVNGRTYYYSFNVDKISEKEAELSGFILNGLDVMQSLIEEPKCSEGAEKNGEGSYTFKTYAAGNQFSSIVLQIYNSETGEPLSTVCTTSGNGVSHGIYTHESESGKYLIRLRANSNLSDEYIEQEVYLEKGQAYGYVFEVTDLTRREAGIDGFIFRARK